MDNNRVGLGTSLAAAALALALGTAAGRTVALRSQTAAPATAPLEQPRQETANGAAAAAPAQPKSPQPTAASGTATAAPAQPKLPQPGAATGAAAAAPIGPKRYMIPVSATQPKTGATEALVTLIQWCDLPDAACAALEPGIRDVLKQHPDSVRLVFRHYDRPQRPGSRIAHEFARAAHEQAGKFWEARALLLAHSGELTLADAERYTQQLGMDWKSVREAINTETFASSITADRIFASMFDVSEPPALFVNGRPLGNKPSAQQLSQMVTDELKNGGELLAQGINKADVYAELTKAGSWNKPNVNQ